MATFFITDSEMVASSSPFRAVRRDAPAAGAKLGEEMGEFVPQCAVDFSGMFLQLGV